MKVLLISSNTAQSPYPLYPLGCSIIAAALIRAGHEVRQFDYLEKNSSLSALEDEIKENRPQIIGISIRNIDNTNMIKGEYYIGAVKEIVARIKAILNIRIVLGGAGFSLMPELILRETGADYGICGEGEAVIVDFINNAALDIYPQGRILKSKTPLEGDEILSASYDEKILKYYIGKGGELPVQTKRGCADRCIYCTYPLLEGHQIRPRNPLPVIDDIQMLANEFGVKNFFFTDSIFNDAEGHYLTLLNEMAARNIRVPWTAFFTPVGLNDEIVELMKSTGLTAAEIGSDAASDSILKGLGKKFNFEDIVACNDLLGRHQIACAHYFMFGGPKETQETVIEGIKNIKSLKKCVSFISAAIRIFPETKLAAIARSENVIQPDTDLLNPVYYISPAVNSEWLKNTLTQAFAGSTNCVFPPNVFDHKAKILYKLGYSGPLWKMLIPGAEGFKIYAGK